MARPNIVPINKERTFDMEELFFSTTDRKGVILSGNAVFARVADYGTVENLIGRPHNIIRHPDMPRAVFKLLWDTIEAGRPIAAYVKNMARDGAYYWVLALVMPTADGYVSVRFKPSTPFFEAVANLYTEVRALERPYENAGTNRDEGMRLGLERLGEAVAALGFESYDAFMQTLVAAEMANRDATLAHREPAARAASGAEDGKLAHLRDRCEEAGGHLNRLFGMVHTFLALNEKLKAKSDFLLELAQDIRLLSLNMLVQANHLGAAGQSLSVVADRMARDADENTRLIGATAGTIGALIGSLRETAFAISAARLQVEMATFFLGELLDGEGAEEQRDAATRQRVTQDLATLTGSFTECTRRITGTLPHARDLVRRLRGSADQLASALRTLGFIHLTGKVEATRLTDSAQFAALFQEAGRQVERAKEEVDDFATMIRQLEEDTSRMEQPAMTAEQVVSGLAGALSG